MAAKAITIDDAKKANISVIEDDRGSQAVHDVVTAYRANRRAGTASTKTRSDVAGGNKKPWRQKGTGRARAGSTVGPIWTGGGVAFGPHPRSYAKSVNRKTRRLAFRRALSSRIEAGDVLSSGSLSISDGKTKSFVAEIAKLTEAVKVLVVGNAFDDSTYLAARNVKSVLLMTAAEVNVEQLLAFDKIVILDDAMETLAGRTA